MTLTPAQVAPKVQKIVAAFSQAIESGEWAPGSKLPSVRELTQTLGVSKFTLNEALDRLRFIKARDFLQLQLMLLGVQLTCSLVQAAFPPHQRVHWQRVTWFHKLRVQV